MLIAPLHAFCERLSDGRLLTIYSLFGTISTESRNILSSGLYTNDE